jgi:hypothetical protein
MDSGQRTWTRDAFSLGFERISLRGMEIEGVIQTDQNVDASYDYLIGGGR